VLEQQETDDQLRVFGRPSDIGKMRPLFLFQLFPSYKVRNPQPTVSLIELPAEGKKLRKKRDGFAVFALIHGMGLLRRVQGFRGGYSKNHAVRA
jgi:hypothetical protein